MSETFRKSNTTTQHLQQVPIIIAGDPAVICERALRLDVQPEGRIYTAIVSSLIHFYGRGKGKVYSYVGSAVAHRRGDEKERLLEEFNREWNSKTPEISQAHIDGAITLAARAYREMSYHGEDATLAENLSKYLKLASEKYSFNALHSSILSDLSSNLLAYADVVSFVLRYFEVNGEKVLNERRMVAVEHFSKAGLDIDSINFILSMINHHGAATAEELSSFMTTISPIDERKHDELKDYLKAAMMLAVHPNSPEEVRRRALAGSKKLLEYLMCVSSEESRLFSQLHSNFSILMIYLSAYVRKESLPLL